MFIRTVGLREVQLKLAAAPARILAQNLEMVEAMLAWVKVETVAATPLGPGHFGYHLRDSFTTDSRFAGLKTIGVLKAPAQGYWREFGTRGSFRRGSRASASMARAAFTGAVLGQFGERAFMTAHHALGGARRIIRMFYSGRALWWRA